MSGPLTGIRVLDLTRVLAGPVATQTLADLGAEVIKVERPGAGDDTRGWGPPYVKDARGKDTIETTYFAGANRGKKSVTIDITRGEGQELVRKMAGHCDVFIENFKAGTLSRYGLSYHEVVEARRDIVYCSITGFGQTGPYAARPGYDPIAQALSGLMSVTGEPEDMPGTVPQRVGVAVIDLMTAHYAVIAVVSALYHRQATGRGQYIDMSLLDVGVASMANIASAYLGAGVIAKRNGGVHPSVVPSQVFLCKDGYVIVAAGNDGQFAKLCEAAGMPDLVRDPRFTVNSARVKNREALKPLLETMFLEHPVSWWNAKLAAAGVPCAPINDIAQVFEDPQVRHRGMRVEMPDPEAGKATFVASPLRLSETRVEYKLPPPLLGEHSQEVLKSMLGMPEEEIRRLRAANII
ncbi:MAG TPA: CaiB/BaiF CoA-transferase family protein [Burkholderiales bacterium]|nr:CaiB/BaiF CoA-transferase family protein [Burkholderiales bacterium]